MTPPIFHLDDEVETANGTRFKISQIWKRTDGSFAYSVPNQRWFHADDLRLVPDELKIGDWVKVIGPNTTDPSDDSELGDVFQISEIRDTSLGRKYSADDHYRYLASSLRKLTPEEVKQHMNPGKPTYEYPITPAKDFDELTLKDIARMSGICKNEHGVWISTLLGRAHKNEERLSTIENRLTFVEKFQRDQDNLMGRAIRDGVVEILDFRRKA